VLVIAAPVSAPTTIAPTQHQLSLTSGPLTPSSASLTNQLAPQPPSAPTINQQTPLLTNQPTPQAPSLAKNTFQKSFPRCKKATNTPE